MRFKKSLKTIAIVSILGSTGFLLSLAISPKIINFLFDYGVIVLVAIIAIFCLRNTLSNRNHDD